MGPYVDKNMLKVSYGAEFFDSAVLFPYRTTVRMEMLKILFTIIYTVQPASGCERIHPL